MTATTTFQNTALPLAAEMLLPHRPPMLWVDSLLERSDNKAKGMARMPKQGICFDSEQLLPEYFIELMAQTMALANGYDALCSDQPSHDGMLVAIDSFVFLKTAAPGSCLHIIVEKKFEFGAIKIIEGQIVTGKTLLAKGTIKVWENLKDGR